jgi:hypothetical protein
VIDRVKSGVLLSDVHDCYPDLGRITMFTLACSCGLIFRILYGLEHHVLEMIVGGKIIAVKNSEKRTQTLYPRGKPFLTTLPGDVKAVPG